MKKTWVVIGIGFLALILAVGYVFMGQQRQDTSPSFPSPTLSPSQAPSENSNIRVTSPKANQYVSLPIRITGEARVFENQLQYRLMECDGDILLHGIMTAQSPDVGLFGPFEEVIDIIPDPQGKSGCIEVFSSSPKDGSDINLVQIPIRYDVAEARKVNVYWSSDESGENCSTVFHVARLVSSTPKIAQVTIEELLRGPTALEKQQGYQTSINPGVSIQKLTIEDGTAFIDFDKQLEEAVGGSCRVSIIRSQITQTLMQFPTVDSVQISIDGRTEDILQP